MEAPAPAALLAGSRGCCRPGAGPAARTGRRVSRRGPARRRERVHAGCSWWGCRGSNLAGGGGPGGASPQRRLPPGSAPRPALSSGGNAHGLRAPGRGAWLEAVLELCARPSLQSFRGLVKTESAWTFGKAGRFIAAWLAGCCQLAGTDAGHECHQYRLFLTCYTEPPFFLFTNQQPPPLICLLLFSKVIHLFFFFLVTPGINL